MTQRLSVEQIRAALMAAAQTVIDHQSVLTKADQAIGDGDHGLGMARGFTALREALSKDRHDSDAASLFKAGGHAIMMTSGGASGVIFGSFFIGCSNFLRADGLDARAFASALAGGTRCRSGQGQGQSRRQDDGGCALARGRGFSRSGRARRVARQCRCASRASREARVGGDKVHDRHDRQSEKPRCAFPGLRRSRRADAVAVLEFLRRRGEPVGRSAVDACFRPSGGFGWRRIAVRLE